MTPSDIQIPNEVQKLCPAASESYVMRLCLLSEGSPIDENMHQIALKEAFEIELQETGVLFL